MSYDVEVVRNPATTTIVEQSGTSDTEFDGVDAGTVEVLDVPQLAQVVEVNAAGFITGSAAQVLAAERVELALDQQTIYRGEAVGGSDESAPIWRIRKVTLGYGNLTSTTAAWPDGSKEFGFAWSERLSYTYI